ncbi:hypothetical protein AVEN_159095-1 [Araneus ventricosus]|uniref:Uncharacterized protein n=1 Tax=Araneus ventricosus TaxID=182803 RepID=A0A4Y2BAQ1_ARAVE|nr:hypothetical protein AVEN_159095-1 [Araneus ventricosus]
MENVLPLSSDLTCITPTNSAYLRCNRVSYLEPSVSKAETLLPGYPWRLFVTVSQESGFYSSRNSSNPLLPTPFSSYREYVLSLQFFPPATLLKH